MRNPSTGEFECEIGIRLGKGDLRGAADLAAGCRAAWPHAAVGWLLGSIAALMAGDKKTALRLVETRLDVDGADVQCLLQKAECQFALGDRAAAIATAETAAEHAGDLLPALDGVGEFLFQTGDYRGALRIYERAVAAAPNDAVVRAKRADIHRVLGDLASAERDYRSVLMLTPGAPKAMKALVEIGRTYDGVSASDFQSALAAVPSESSDAAILHFALAKVLDIQRDYVGSWEHLATANRIERARIDYDSETDSAFVERVMEEFTIEGTARAGTSRERPIFIVGIPRTGSTLIERIIGSHPQVHPAGEIPAFSDAIDAALTRGGQPRPEDLDTLVRRLAMLDADALAGEYLRRVQDHVGDRPFFTDKMLTNFFHCGLIVRAFPGARIVHVTRHPLAACYAIYRTRFVGTYPFSYDLEEIGDFYLCYRRLMTHWHSLFPGHILDVAYEDVVSQVEATTRRTLDFIGLPFDPGCLDFHHNPAPVKTTSSAQVRQPLYDTSLHAWRRYASYLAPLAERLRSVGIDCE